MKTLKLLIVILVGVFSTNAIIAQQYQIDSRTINVLNESGIDFSQDERGIVFIKGASENKESFKCNLNVQILRSKQGKFIDDELPEGGFDFKSIMRRVDPIWDCSSEGVLEYQKGSFVFIPRQVCEIISDNLIPGGDMFVPGGDTFVPGGDTFVPGGDTFVPGGDTFSTEDERYHFLKISFDCKADIAPVILPLRIK
jgi:hypothetical protein